MNRFSKFAVFASIGVLLCGFCSCSLLTYDKTEVRGGIPLNDELMAVIKGNILSEASPDDTTDEKSEPSDSESVYVTDEAESDDTDDTASASGNQNADNICYWSESGSVWHTYRDCHHIKNSKNILSGTVKEALEDGKSHVCSSCAKRKE